MAVAVHRRVGGGVEERVELVELLLGHRVELVVVADRAAEGEAEEDGREGFGTVDDVPDANLFGDRAPFAGRDVGPDEAGRHLLVEGGIGEQVAAELLDDELVEPFVRVEGVDDPFAVLVEGPLVVEVQAVRVAVPGEVEPVPRPCARRSGGFEEAVDDRFVGAGRGVGQEGVDFRRRRGRPVRSSVRRRRRVILSASGLGRSPSPSSRARAKRSIGLVSQAVFWTAGRAGRSTVLKDQCF